MSAFSISPEEFLQQYEQKQLDEGQVIDVREQEEWEYYHLENTQSIPMQTVPGKLNDLPKDKPLYIICAHGVRSSMVCQYLLEQGFTQIRNVTGGMAAIAALRGFEYD